MLNAADCFLTYNYINYSIAEEVNPIHLWISTDNISVIVKLLIPTLLLIYAYVRGLNKTPQTSHLIVLSGFALFYCLLVVYLVFVGFTQIAVEYFYV